MRPDTPVDLVLERLQVERAAAVLAALARKPAAEPFLPVLVTDPRATVAATATANPCASDDQVAGVLHRLLPSEQALRELTVTVRRLAVTGMLEYYPQTVTAAVTHGTAGMLDAIVPHLISAEDNRRAAGRLVEELIRQRAPAATVYAWSATDDAAQLLYEAGTAAYEDGLLDDPVYARIEHWAHPDLVLSTGFDGPWNHWLGRRWAVTERRPAAQRVLLELSDRWLQQARELLNSSSRVTAGPADLSEDWRRNADMTRLSTRAFDLRRQLMRNAWLCADVADVLLDDDNLFEVRDDLFARRRYDPDQPGSGLPAAHVLAAFASYPGHQDGYGHAAKIVRTARDRDTLAALLEAGAPAKFVLAHPCADLDLALTCPAPGVTGHFHDVPALRDWIRVQFATLDAVALEVVDRLAATFAGTWPQLLATAATVATGR